MTDTRKDKRAPISLKVRFKSATVDEFIEQYSKDISKGGIFIKSNKNSPPMSIGPVPPVSEAFARNSHVRPPSEDTYTDLG